MQFSDKFKSNKVGYRLPSCHNSYVSLLAYLPYFSFVGSGNELKSRTLTPLHLILKNLGVMQK
jgi:hypothetical protein